MAAKKSTSKKTTSGDTITLTEGTVSVTFPASLALPAQAGKLTKAQLSKVRRARIGVGRACLDAASALTKAGDSFQAPRGVTADALTAAGERADGLDRVITDVVTILTTLKQGNLLIDAAADDLLGQMNDQIKAQGKRNGTLLAKFKAVSDYFARPRKAPSGGPGTGGGGSGGSGGGSPSK